VFEASGVGMALVSTNGVVLRVNRALCQYFGVQTSERASEALLALACFDPGARHETDRQALLRGELAQLQYETSSRRPDGSGAYATITLRAIDSDVEPCFLLELIDVTARRLAEETMLQQTALALRESQAQFSVRQDAERALRETSALWRGILDAANYSIVASSAEGIVREFNAGAERLLGYRASEVIGKLSPDHFHDPEEIAARSEALSVELGEPVPGGFTTLIARARTGSADETEWTFVRKDGSRVPVLLSVTALRDGSGHIQGYLGIASDITERKRVQDELVRAKEAAEAASRAKAEFLARVSHEIRTPMNGVIGMTDLALQTKLDAEQRDYLEMAQSSARGLLHVINDLLDLSRIEARRLTLESIEFDLHYWVGRVIKELGHRAREKNLSLGLTIPENLPRRVVGDPYRLQQVVINLVSNALKFTERGTVSVAAVLEREAGDFVEVAFSVADTGVGIPAEKQDLIFEAFLQAEEATTRKFGGTGLGLAICSQLVGMMGGRIWVDSTLGRGSTFHFTACFQRADSASEVVAPIADGVLGGLPSFDAPGPGSERTVRFERPLRVLVAEDNVVNRAVARAILERAGHSVCLVEDGQAALGALSRERFDLVLMDVQMPNIDGLEATRRLREAERLGATRIPVIAVTAQAQKGDRERCLAAGMDGYVSKPLEQSRLLLAMHSAWSSSAQSASSAPPAAAGQHFEREALLRRLGHDVDLFQEIVALYLADAPPLLDALREHLAQNQLSEAEHEAHQLKGALMNLSADVAAGLARRVEELCHEGRTGELAPALHALEVELGALARAISIPPQA
jgi:PAS domain S-box-containing protein